ncbi:MAG: transcription-repair coupling factor [Planctomycetota bacterium]
MTLRDLVAAFAGLPAARAARTAIDARQHRAAGGLWGASAALLVAALRHGRQPFPMLVVTAHDDDSAALARDLHTFANDDALVLPAQGIDVDGRPEGHSASARVRTLTELGRARRGDTAPLMVCGLEALLQPTVDPGRLGRKRLELSVGAKLAAEAVLAQAASAGLRRVPVVLGPGEISHRGDVLDVFPLGEVSALRVELFDDEIESIRTLDTSTQRSLDRVERVSLALAASDLEEATADVLDHLLARDLVVATYEPLRLADEQKVLLAHGGPMQRAFDRFERATAPLAHLALAALPSQDLDFKILSAGSAVGSGESDPRGRIAALRGNRGRVSIVCPDATQRTRLLEIFAHKELDPEREQVEVVVGSLSRGFRVRELEWTVLQHAEFAGVPPSSRTTTRAPMPSRAISSFFELGPGDLVVHAAHGIAQFEGMERVERGPDAAEDHLRLRFKDDVLLLVPASKIHLVQKYVGAGDAAPRLDRLGGKGFQRRKEEVQQALFDLAAELLDVQAQREAVTRPPYAKDPLEAEFLDGFPFQDTPDQANSSREIDADLESPRPMDRLLCGDVGFGKTEMALRAAFKVAIRGKQVAVLVPTTVLAEQHGETFARRFAPFALRVEVLSRFTHGKSKKAVLEAVGAGQVDVVVGTHRLLGGDVRFKDLGLLVIDEEQRFGVRQKEQFKRLRVAVDVLTLSATPIPRTLHGALVGVRAISTLNTPPPGRQDVETKVAFHSNELVQQAIRRELSRGGQVFYLHNRIEALDRLAQQVRELVPDARVAVGHGQLTETEMERTIRGFVHGDFDVLVCTSIVENGLDIPRANTILIDDANLFGLAELHQLRGRVGRSATQAHCYLLLDPLQPPPEAARKRLKAIEELSHLGAGFAIAMKDLEIRGAGNLLGPQQSGHIAAVGYDMYAQLLHHAVELARTQKTHGEATGKLAELALPPLVEVDVDLRLNAYLPEDFLAEPRARLELLREMDGATDPAAEAELRRGLTDRFGRLPKPVDNLLRVYLVKHLLAPLSVRSVQWVDDRLVVRHPIGTPIAAGAWLDAFADVRPIEAGKTHLILPPRRGKDRGKPWQGDAVLDLLMRALLGPRSGGS